MANSLPYFASLISSNSVLKRLLSLDSSENPPTAQSYPPLSAYFRSWVSSNSFLSRRLSVGPSDDSNRRPSTQPQPPPSPPSFELEEITTDDSVESPLPGGMGMAAASSSTVIAISDSSQDYHTKSVSKLVQTVSSAVAAACVVLFVNLPQGIEPGHMVVYDAHLAFIWLGLCTSLILSIYSILMPREPWVAWVQKRVMVIAIAFVLLALVLRTFLVLPMASFRVTWLFFFFGAGGVGIYLVLAWKHYGPMHGGRNRS